MDHYESNAIVGLITPASRSRRFEIGGIGYHLPLAKVDQKISYTMDQKILDTDSTKNCINNKHMF